MLLRRDFLCAVVPLVSPLCLLLHLYRSCLSSVSSPSSLPLMSLLCVSSMSLRCVSFMPPPSSLSLFSFPLCPLCHLCRAAMKIWPARSVLISVLSSKTTFVDSVSFSSLLTKFVLVLINVYLFFHVFVNLLVFFWFHCLLFYWCTDLICVNIVSLIFAYSTCTLRKFIYLLYNFFFFFYCSACRYYSSSSLPFFPCWYFVF